jgi:hypothetical protein
VRQQQPSPEPEKPIAPNPAEITVACRVCREPIKQGARKCVHCNSMLDWHGWLGISETALALLVALVSVIGATAPRLVEFLRPKSSDTRLTIRQVYGQYLELVAWNHGSRSSQVLSASISATTQNGTQLSTVPLQIISVPNVPPEQSALIQLQVHPAWIPTFLDWPHPAIQTGVLTVVVNEYRKGPDTRKIDIPLDEFRLFCRATEDIDAISRHLPGVVDLRSTTRCIAH